MALPTTATFLTNAAQFMQPRISASDQQLLRVTAKVRCLATSITLNPVPTLNSGTAAEWKTILASAETVAQTGGTLTKEQLMAATINALWFASAGSQQTFATAVNFTLPMKGFLDETRLARIEAWADFQAYNCCVANS